VPQLEFISKHLEKIELIALLATILSLSNYASEYTSVKFMSFAILSLLALLYFLTAHIKSIFPGNKNAQLTYKFSRYAFALSAASLIFFIMKMQNVTAIVFVSAILLAAIPLKTVMVDKSRQRKEDMIRISCWLLVNAMLLNILFGESGNL
jgi:hypothetical protein